MAGWGRAWRSCGPARAVRVNYLRASPQATSRVVHNIWRLFDAGTIVRWYLITIFHGGVDDINIGQVTTVSHTASTVQLSNTAPAADTPPASARAPRPPHAHIAAHTAAGSAASPRSRRPLSAPAPPSPPAPVRACGSLSPARSRPGSSACPSAPSLVVDR